MRKLPEIMVGMGSIDDYPDYVQAGAEEIFAGYVPYSWVRKYGTRNPLNRREVLYYNVQIGSFSELQILSEMVKSDKVAVSLTLNSLSYPRNSYEEIWEIMGRCHELGFRSFIIADHDFLQYLWQKEEIESYQITVSGEYGELNESILRTFVKNHVKRVIFPRQTTLSEMEELIAKYPQMEYEAFLLNEKCHFTGAYCNSMHCDEICHMCRVPYRFTETEKDSVPRMAEAEGEILQENVTGVTGCGLCALWRLNRCGVQSLKIVSRGNGSEDTISDIQTVKKALVILDESETEEQYIRTMKKEIFPGGCSQNCYYLL